MEALRQATLAGTLDVSDYDGRGVDQFLKVDESSYGDDLSNDTVIGLTITGIVIVLICTSVICYWLRRKRVGNMKGNGGTQMADQYS